MQTVPSEIASLPGREQSGTVPAAAPSPLAITMGDAAGIGPEIIAKAFTAGCGPSIVYGSARVMADVVARLALTLQVHKVAGPEEAHFRAGVIDVVDACDIREPPPLGRISPACGKAAFDALLTAIDAAKAGTVKGIVTAPINKEAMAAAGLSYPGHTEILAAHGGATRVAMMLANDEIRTVLVTIHTALRLAIEQADFAAQMAAIRFAHEGGRALGIPVPRIAVAGLNPHAGEGGLFGTEEIEIIAPAIAAARREGIDASGPWPGDTVFLQARQGRFDVVVAQYHDQGLIPIKYLGLDRGVNITLGLPFIRTSPDHGTAFDIAGQGIADPASLMTAIAYARRLIEAKADTERGQDVFSAN
ncbi:4-hydroxythreonine-4-phosphate dehydrogenase PdxA [Labrys sp. La1]|uniref:4-hydroxythreonine-4-phosphate dehydrogenase PdxA n=1 Tax=Labrys sp. La1 TaxID=3404917 RepID=UPI003EB72281